LTRWTDALFFRWSQIAVKLLRGESEGDEEIVPLVKELMK
jgi:hypothetical protein